MQRPPKVVDILSFFSNSWLDFFFHSDNLKLENDAYLQN